MIIDNGFYCEVLTGSPQHEEAVEFLKKQNVKKFPLKREILAGLRSKGIIKTESKIKSKPDKKIDNIIELFWYKSNSRKNYKFKDALKYIEDLNANSKAKGRSEVWRLPTLKELLAIAESNTKNHFPKDFDFSEKGNLIFWSSTAVKKEGTVLEYDKHNSAYFVVRSIYDKGKNTYSLHFANQNIEGKGKGKAYVLPIYTEKVDMYKCKPDVVPQASPKGADLPGFDDNAPIPGFEDSKSSSGKSADLSKEKNTKETKKKLASDKIPGFDDVPDPSNTSLIESKSNRGVGPDSKTGNKRYYSKKSTSSKIKIAIFPHTYSGMTGERGEKDSLNHISEEIEKELNSLKLKIKKLNLELIIIKENSYSLNNNLKTLYNILHNRRLEKFKERTFVLNATMSGIMNSENIDIIVTVKHDIIGTDVELLVPIIISAIDYEVYYLNLGQNQGRNKHLRGFVRKKILSIIYNNKYKI